MPAVNHEERKVGYNYIHCYNTTPSLRPIITPPRIQVMPYLFGDHLPTGTSSSLSEGAEV